MKAGATRSLAGLAAASAGAAWWTVRHFTAPAVRAWKPGCGEFRQSGRLVTRVAGFSQDRATVLLHGFVSSGETFGGAFDVLAHDSRLVVPDLLGFGRSMDLTRSSFSLGDHLDALDNMLADLGLSDARLSIGGHSLGGLIALHWAARRKAQVDKVTLWGAPIFRDQDEARERLKKMGMLESLFARDTALARRSCQLMCQFRGTARVLAIALSPDLPIPISGRAILHTWPAYRDGIEIFNSDWLASLEQLDRHEAPITLMAGSKDSSQVPGLREMLAEKFPHVRAITVPDATHILPITHGGLCAKALGAAI